MFVLKLLLRTTAYDEAVLSKRFNLLNRCHNVLVKRANYLFSELSKDPDYKKLLKRFHELQPLKDNPKYKDVYKDACNNLNDYRDNIGLSKAGLYKYISSWQARNKVNLSSFICQKEVDRVYDGVKRVLFSNSKHLHYHKADDQHTICTKDETNGIKLNIPHRSLTFMGDKIKFAYIEHDDYYKLKALRMIYPDLSNVAYGEICREPFRNGYHYYVDIYIKEKAPIKYPVGNNTAGLDPGVSIMAYVSDNQVILTELAPKCKDYNKAIMKASRDLDISRRAANPDNYNPDGTVKKGIKLKWIKSKTYKKRLFILKNLYRRKAEYLKQSHEKLSNTLIKDSNTIYTEDMNYKGLSKRSKTTERQDKSTEIQRKDGSTVAVRKYKRKKRFGKSLNNRAPAMFLSILKRKLKASGGELITVKTSQFKASQYDHTTDTYEKHELSERFKTIGGKQVQRDAYSAFLLRHSNSKLDKPNRKKCVSDFDNFVVNMNQCIEDMKLNGITYKVAFGF